MILCCERDVHGIHCRQAPHLSFSRLSLHTVAVTAAAAACMSHAGVFFFVVRTFEPSLVFVVCVCVCLRVAFFPFRAFRCLLLPENHAPNPTNRY